MHWKKLVNWYFTRDSLPYWTVLLFDCVAVFLSGIAACAVIHGPAHTVANLGAILRAYLIYLLPYLIGFRIFHAYVGVFRQLSYGDLTRVVLSLMVGVAIIMVLRVCGADDWIHPIRLRILLVQMLLATVSMCGMRVMVKVLYDFYLRHNALGGAYGLNDSTLLDMEMKDLLPRSPIHISFNEIRDDIRGKCIMVTGAAGSIGSELARVLAVCQPATLLLVDQAETPLHDVRMEMVRRWPSVHCLTLVTSVCHGRRMRTLFERYRPEIVFHAAAYKHVPMMEDNPIESVLNNVDATVKLADLSVDFGVRKFIMISTDKAVNPTSVMGCSKRICEIYCQSLAHELCRHQPGGGACCQFITTRFGNVLGSNGSVIPIFREQIRRGGPVLVTHPDITRYFMLIPEACQLVLEASTIGHGGEIFVFDMGHPVRIAELAKQMIELSGKTNVEIQYVGLRPGEKLYEEVLNNEEKVLPTRHPKIKIAQVREYDYKSASQLVRHLIETALTYDCAATLREMKLLVPEYHSNNAAANAHAT